MVYLATKGLCFTVLGKEFEVEYWKIAWWILISVIITCFDYFKYILDGKSCWLKALDLNILLT